MGDRLLKVIIWRIVSILMTVAILFAFTGDIKSSTGITFLLHFFLTISHFIFETVWENLNESR